MKRAFPAAALLLSGCGYIGNPMPPTLDIPSRVPDLTVMERGDKIVARFTIPPLTTEGMPLKSVRRVELRAGVAPDPFSMSAWVAGARPFELAPTGPGQYTPEIPATDWVGKTVTMAVRAIGPKGKSSDWSNLRQLPIGAPLPTPADLKIENIPAGIELTWRGPSAHYRVFRAIADEEPTQAAETDKPSWIDSPVEYGMRYRYWVIAFNGELQTSDTAGPVELTPKDTFPPAIPAGLTGEPGVNTIELSWERNTESDFKGYNLFRGVDGGPFERIATLITAPTYSDRMVERGKKYRYQVSAVDTLGNESQRSAAIEITAQ